MTQRLMRAWKYKKSLKSLMTLNTLTTLMPLKSSSTTAQTLLRLLRERNYTFASAESCTGGNIAHTVTEIPGCSDVMLGAVVSYCNEVKHKVLGVSEESLESFGAVSEPVVRQMAEGVRRVLGADCSVATSGIAGPGGAVPGKPVGTVWIAVSTPEQTVAGRMHFDGDRSDVISQATEAALTMLCRLLG